MTVRPADEDVEAVGSPSYMHTAHLEVDFLTPKARVYLGDRYDRRATENGQAHRYLKVSVEAGSREECAEIIAAFLDSLADELRRIRGEVSP